MPPMRRSGKQHDSLHKPAPAARLDRGTDSGKSDASVAPRLIARLRLLAVAGVVALITLGVHWPVLDCRARCFDDDMFLFKNPYLMNPSWSAAGRVLGEVRQSSTIKGYYEPLTLLSLMGDVAMGGSSNNLRPFHRTSLALHALNTVLLVALMHALFGNVWAAGLAGLMFGLHPLTVEPVAWVWERKTPLAMFFVLLCMLAYTGYVRLGRRSLYVAALLAFVLAVMSKPTAVPLPVGLILLDVWPFDRLARRTLLEKLPFLALALAAGLIAVISTQQNASVTLPGQTADGPVVWRLVYLAAMYLGKMLWPLNLSPYYQLPNPLALSNPIVLICLLVLLLLAGLAVLSLRRTRAVAVGLAVFFLLISPTLGIIGYSWVVASDKYVYLPSIGALLGIASGLTWGWTHLRRPGRRAQMVFVSAVLLIVGLEVVGTRRQLGHWRDSESLFRHAVALAPEAPVLRNYLALALVSRGAVDEAITHWREAIRLNPRYAIGYANLANAHLMKREYGQAIECYRQALVLDPEYPEAHYNLARALAALGDGQTAVHHFEQAIRLRPHYVLAHQGLALEWIRQREFARATRHFIEAVRLQPNLEVSYRRMVEGFAKAGNLDAALAVLQAVLEVRPRDVGLRREVEALFSQRGTFSASPIATQASQPSP